MFKVLTRNEYYRQSQRLLLYVKIDSVIGNCSRYKSHYSSLGLNSDASPKEIKSAYYDLSLKFHPDKNKGSAESVKKFREISEAYEVLGNKEKKRIYDDDLNSRYSESTWRRENYSTRPDQFRSRPRSAYRTGRDEYYDYDEHYRKHYEEYHKQQEMDYEYFRRRWKAEFRRRYPFVDEEQFENYRQRQQYRRAKQQYTESSKITISQNRSFIYFMSFWLILGLSLMPFMDEPPKTFKTVYYKITPEDNESSDKKEF